MPEEIERLYTINFTRVYKVGPKNQRAARLVKYIREFVGHHMKAEDAKVWIDETVNESMWGRGILKPPRNIRVKVTKFDDGVVEVTLPEVEKKEGKKAKALAEEKKAEEEKAAKKAAAAATKAAKAAAEAKPAEAVPVAAPAPAAPAAVSKPVETKKE
ncbi:MAG: 50S ribosomal protein L31e [Candidatus Thermoplasmatota archaeon]|nr:50S ribosomal protein L31e [Candidatus Thermoplasmatota archaeon]